jgi:hypothetical protein
MKALYILLLVANTIVLLGQVWPEGAPSFAHTVNVATLAVNVLVFLLLVTRGRGKKG